MKYSVNVGNIGNIDCQDKKEAQERFDCYVEQSNTEGLRATGEDIVLLKDNEIIKEYIAAIEHNFIAHGACGMGNGFGVEVEVSENGDSGRLRFSDGDTSNWIEMQYGLNAETEEDSAYLRHYGHNWYMDEFISFHNLNK